MQIMKYRVTNLKIIFIYERQYHLVSKAECQSDILCNHYVIIAYNVEHNINIQSYDTAFTNFIL